MSSAFGSPTRKTRILVAGAGAFGGWTALHLQRRGAQVTLCDAWGPGNSRASSGGETRIIRATYGPDRPYVQMAVRALEIWKEHEKRWNTPVSFGWLVRMISTKRRLCRCCAMPVCVSRR